MNLKGKTVLVTGSSKGIGASTALKFAEKGANLILHYNSSESEMNEIDKQVLTFGAETLKVQADLTKSIEIKKIFEKIQEKFKNIDVLVNNAGGSIGSNNQLDLENWRKTFDLNLFSVIDITNSAVKLMNEGSKIINVSSLYGIDRYGSTDVIAYDASKAAINSLTRNLAKLLSPKILVNAIAPGYVLTPSWGNLDEQSKKRLGDEQLIKRFIESEEVADGIVFLAQNDAMNGEVMVLDGGLSLNVVN